MYRNLEYISRQHHESVGTILSPQPDVNLSSVKLQSELFFGGCPYSVTTVALMVKYM